MKTTKKKLIISHKSKLEKFLHYPNTLFIDQHGLTIVDFRRKRKVERY